jgi:hypothetical protein
MLKTNNYRDDPLCGIGVFYQHGRCRYYLTPRQFEQLKWREEIVRRRRVADALDEDNDEHEQEEYDNDESNYTNRSRKHRRKGGSCDKIDVTTNTSVRIGTKSTRKNTQNDTTTINESTTTIVAKPLIRNQRKYRIKDEEDERTNIFMSISPTFYQICKGNNGCIKRMPISPIQQERPCHTFVASNKILPFVLEDDQSESSSINDDENPTYKLENELRE